MLCTDSDAGDPPNIENNDGDHFFIAPTGEELKAIFGTIAVQISNHNPTVIHPGNQRNTEGSSVSLQVVASDPDGDTLSYRATGLPWGLSMDRQSGIISGTIEYDAVLGSPYAVLVTVQDGNGGSKKASLSWSVVENLDMSATSSSTVCSSPCLCQ